MGAAAYRTRTDRGANLMHLYDWPLVFILIGLVLYVVLGGADFGAGFWELIAGRGRDADEIRDHAHHSMAPVWEANHVWLIFVLTVMWTAYPAAFGSIASTLCIPLFVAGIGIVMRGAAYAVRGGATSPRQIRMLDTVFGISSILTPFALGAMVGGIASLRVPEGNAAGNLVTSWLNPTGITIGVIAVATSAYLAAVYLAADAEREGNVWLVEAFQIRALGAGVLAGLAAFAGIVVLRFDAHRLFDRLLESWAVVAVAASVVAGLTTIGLVAARRFELARYTSAIAVAAVIAGWGIAQNPLLLRDLTVQQAAAGRSTLVAVIFVVIGGAIILFPSLALLFRLVLGGHLGHGSQEPKTPSAARTPPVRSRVALRLAVALAIVGIGLTTVADGPWEHAFGVTCLLAFVVAGFVAVGPAELAKSESGKLGGEV
jgi:cytochrome bd ubiquinol oxidase subunit II